MGSSPLWKVERKGTTRVVRCRFTGTTLSKYDPDDPVVDGVWALLALPAMLDLGGYRARHALIVGYGAGTTAWVLRSCHQGIGIFGVDRDEQLLKLAKEWGQPGQTMAVDALSFVATRYARQYANTVAPEPAAEFEKYDLVIEDCFKGAYKPDWTLAGWDMMHTIVHPSGIFVANTTEDHAVEAKKALRTMYKNAFCMTLPELKNHVYVATNAALHKRDLTAALSASAAFSKVRGRVKVVKVR